jgi:hypothetical protein
MFTTNQHIFLYIPLALYGIALGIIISGTFKSGRFVSLLVACGGLIHLFYLLGRGWISGIFFANPMVDGPYLVPLVMALSVFLLPQKAHHQRGILLAGEVLFSLILLFYSRGFIPPTPQKLGILPVLFFLTENMAHGFFYGGALLAVFTFWRDRTSLSEGGAPFHRFILWGLVLFTMSQIIGAVWCFVGWGATFHWSPRHLMTSGIWILYANYIHLHYLDGFNLKIRSLYAMVSGALVAVLSYSHVLHEMQFPRIGG